jgi:hypothetical protein
MRKMLNAAWVVLAHAVVLVAAHHVATHIGAEIVSLVKDEWLVGIADRVLALGE